MVLLNPVNGPANANASSNGEGAFRRLNSSKKKLLGEIPKTKHLIIETHVPVASFSKKGIDFPEGKQGWKVCNVWPGSISGTAINGKWTSWLQAMILPVEIDPKTKLPVFLPSGEVKYVPENGLKIYQVKPGAEKELLELVAEAKESAEFKHRTEAGEEAKAVLMELVLKLQSQGAMEKELADNQLLVAKLLNQNPLAPREDAEPAAFKCPLSREVLEALEAAVEEIAGVEKIKQTVKVRLYFDRLGVPQTTQGKNGGLYPYIAGSGGDAVEVKYPDGRPLYKVQFNWPEPVAVEIIPGEAMPQEPKYQLPRKLQEEIMEASLKKNVAQTLDQGYIDCMVAKLKASGKNQWPWTMGLLLKPDGSNRDLHESVASKVEEWKQILPQVVGYARSPWGERPNKEENLTLAEAEALSICVEQGDSKAWLALKDATVLAATEAPAALPQASTVPVPSDAGNDIEVGLEPINGEPENGKTGKELFDNLDLLDML